MPPARLQSLVNSQTLLVICATCFGMGVSSGLWWATSWPPRTPSEPSCSVNSFSMKPLLTEPEFTEGRILHIRKS